jgi:ribosomal protein L40E
VTHPTPAPAATPPTLPAGARPEPTHACVRCGAQVPIDVGLCERCNPLGLRDSSASQVHGIAVIGVILAVVALAFFAHLAVQGTGPYPATAAAVVDGDGQAVTLTVTNQGTSEGQTKCRVTDPADRTGNTGALLLSPRIGPKQTVTFTQHVTEFGTDVRALAAECFAP